ncbi:Protein of unknown function DUF3576 [Candidatus Pelagibacterales bacterium]
MKKSLLIISIILLTLSCSKTDPVTGEKIIIEPDPVKKARDAAARGGGLFGEIGGQKSSGQTLNFGTSNVLWRATLKSLEFLPLISSDYSGGILIYDWYSQANNPKEQIKISVQFLNNELRSDSVKIIAHKRICENVDKCSNLVVEQKFIDTVKDNIITVARSLKIEEAKKEKK